MTLPVSPWEAALGATVPVETPGGPVKVQVPAGTPSGRRLRLRGQGMPNAGSFQATPSSSAIEYGAVHL